MYQTVNTDSKKYYTALILIIVYLCFNLNLNAQDTNLDFKLTISPPSSSEANDGTITIEVDGSSSEYIFMIFDKEPWNDGKRIREDETGGSTKTYVNLSVGNYVVCVQDNGGVVKYKKISIEIN